MYTFKSATLLCQSSVTRYIFLFLRIPWAPLVLSEVTWSPVDDGTYHARLLHFLGQLYYLHQFSMEHNNNNFIHAKYTWSAIIPNRHGLALHTYEETHPSTYSRGNTTTTGVQHRYNQYTAGVLPCHGPQSIALSTTPTSLVKPYQSRSCFWRGEYTYACVTWSSVCGIQWNANLKSFYRYWNT